MKLSDINDYSDGKVFSISLLMGITHVLMGPDHISAILIFVAGARRRLQLLDENKNKIKECFLQGFRWSVGHCLGLGIITSIFMCFRSSIPMSKISEVSDIVVGVMMMMIGTFSLVSLYKWYLREKRLQIHLNSTDVSNENNIFHPEGALPISIRPSSQGHIEVHSHNMSHIHENNNDTIEEPRTVWIKFRKWRMGDTTVDSPTNAYIVGAIHGISGVSGVVYILPATFLYHGARILLYMFGFFVSSTASMSVLSTCIGVFPSSNKKLMVLNGVAGISALGTGIVWIVLVSMGKLDL